MQQTGDWSKTRIEMSTVGAVGGGAAWWLLEVLPDMLSNDRLGLLISMSVLGLFLVTMAMMGPVRLRPAALGGLGLSVGIALLTFWASFRFDSAGDFIESGHPAAAVLVLYLVGIPFLLVMLEHGRGGWKDYAALFQTAWTVIVRFLAASLFTLIVWGVIFLSNVLLELVSISVIEDLLEIDPVPLLISGGVFGLALAVAFEWRDYISPHLLLRLLRLLVPMVVPVLTLFLVAVLLNGLENVLHVGSQTALLTAVAIGGITLVTVSVDRDASHQASARLLRWSVKVLAVLLLPLTLLAVWGIGIRVAEYGWTPERLLAALSVGMVVLYGASYAVLVLFPGDWAGRLRGVNIALALLSFVLAGLWLTPVLNAERIAARSQMARIMQGQVTPDQAPMWELAQQWGDAGRQALAALRAAPDYPNRAEILALADKAEQADTRYKYTKSTPDASKLQKAEELARLVPLRPEGTTLPEGAFKGVRPWRADNMIEACKRTYDDGRPGCVYLQVAFRPDLSVPQGVLLLRETDTRVSGHTYVLRDGQLKEDAPLGDWRDGWRASLPGDTVLRVLNGDFQIEPAHVNVLKIGGETLFPDN